MAAAIRTLGVVVGSGGSLKDFDFRLLNDRRILSIALNHEIAMNAAHYIPRAWLIQDALAADLYRDHYLPKEIDIWVGDKTFQVLEEQGKALPSWWRRAKCHNYRVRYNVATAAVDLLAKTYRVDEIALLGCDLYGGCYNPAHPGHQRYLTKSDVFKDPLQRWIQFAQEFDHPCPVHQCSLNSPLNVFPKRPFEEVRSRLAAG